MKLPPGLNPLRLEIGEHTLTFLAVEDFRFALMGRGDVPAAKVRDLESLSPDEVWQQAVDVRKVEHRLIEIVSESFTAPLSIETNLRELSPRLFTEDHQWRDIFKALRAASGQFADYKRVAVLEYLGYLGERQELLNRAYAAKKADMKDGPAGDRPAFKETTIFRSGDLVLPEAAGDDSGMVRLPRCVATDVRLPAGREVEVDFSTHRFKLVRAKNPYLVDEHGVEHAIRGPMVTAGRGPDNDIVIDVAFRSASRRHLVLEMGSGDTVRMTDFSSHGTFVPREALVEAPLV